MTGKSLRSAAMDAVQSLVSGLKIFAQDLWRRVAPYVGHNPDRDNLPADHRTESGGMGETGVSNQAAKGAGSPHDLSGRGMDRRIDTSRKKLFIGIGVGVAVLAFAAFAWAVRPAPAGVNVVKAANIQIDTAMNGQLDDFVSALGTVSPGQTVYLDAVEGGRVERVLVLNGDTVKKDQVLLELSNTQLQLDVLTRETEVSGQLNSLREKELDMERSKLSNARNLAQALSQRDQLSRRVARNERLAKEGAYPPATLEDEKAQLVMAEELLKIAEDQKETDERVGKSQMEQMRLSTQRMQRNLDAARASLDALVVRAPVDGVLTSFNPELGQSLNKNTRVGQIDSVEDLKLTVAIDEFYLERFHSGLPAEAKIGDETVKLSVGRVSAQVENGVFKADLLFAGEDVPQLRRGQSFPVKVTLSESTTALIVPRGPWYTSTGGRWAFVVSKDGNRAERRDIKLGRSNASAVEVLEGIKPGEKIVTSDYEGFTQAKGLQIRK
jgi:HlyD family secretion protein